MPNFCENFREKFLKNVTKSHQIRYRYFSGDCLRFPNQNIGLKKYKKKSHMHYAVIIGGCMSALGREICRMLNTQFTLGEMKDGDEVFIKMASDGTQIPRKDHGYRGKRKEGLADRNRGNRFSRGDI